MKKILSYQRAIKSCLAILGLLVCFHLSILIAMIFFDFLPLDFLWGGRLKTYSELRNFEIISLLVSLLFFVLVWMRSRGEKYRKYQRYLKVAMFVLSGYFCLNTLGNLLAVTHFERIFSVVTLVLALLLWRIAIEPIPTKVVL
ncbi:hypothetical protein [Membranihabitans marinus]|uniref:hypothetical protein n=1 Tax=Membranihabitans marinus TaxID=1227546 RepID=UPI001F336480|nr:hypothetical protein [Membranihabitans marinus]